MGQPRQITATTIDVYKTEVERFIRIKGLYNPNVENVAIIRRQFNLIDTNRKAIFTLCVQSQRHHQQGLPLPEVPDDHEEPAEEPFAVQAQEATVNIEAAADGTIENINIEGGTVDMNAVLDEDDGPGKEMVFIHLKENN